MTLFKTRNYLPLILNEMGLTGTWVEVGVERGVFSKALIEKGKFNRLILIDPWTVEGWFTDITQKQLDEYFLDVCGLQDERVTVLRSTSLEMSKIVEERLDFVYLDAKHDVESVKKDIGAWWPKIKPGGMLAGHDFYMVDVKMALSDFLFKHKRQLFVACEEQAQSWYVIK